MKFMSKIYLSLCFIVVFTSNVKAQKAIVLDEVIAVVGDQIATKSELETKYAAYLAQSASIEKGTRCKILEDILYSKMLVNQAGLDSIFVDESQVEGELDRRIRYYIAQIGSQQAMEDYYKKPLAKIKEEFRVPIREQLTLQRMQSEITSGISITPQEVKEYFEKIPTDSLPLINAEVELAQIVIYAKTSQGSIKEVKDKLTNYRKRVTEGENFSTLALLYSEDKGSALKGGEIGFVGRGEVEPEFGAASFKLKVGNVSPIIETRYGYHIIQLIERRANKVNVRHILLKPKQDKASFDVAKTSLDSIAVKVNNGAVGFTEAAKRYSEDEDTKNNGGILANPQTSSSMTPMDELDPSLFFVIDKMDVDQISDAVIISDPRSKPGYRIVKIQKRTEPHRASLAKDYQKIKTAALAEKEQSILQDWVKNNLTKTYIKLNTEYCVNCEFQQAWLEKSAK